jgi:hypothetical protein
VAKRAELHTAEPDALPQSTPAQSSLQHVRDAVACLAARLAGIAAVRATEGSGGGVMAPAGRDEAIAPIVPPGGGEARLLALAALFGLEPADLDLLLVAMAPEIDARFATIYAELQGDRTRARSTIQLAFEACGLVPWSAAVRARLGPDGPLVTHRLVVVEDPDLPFLARPLRVPDRVVAHVLGDDAFDPLLMPLLAPLVPSAIPGADALATALAAGVGLCWIRESPRASGLAMAATAFTSLGAPALALDLRRLPDGGGVAETFAVAIREATLRGAGLVLGPIDVARDRTTIARLGDPLCPVVLFGPNVWDPQWSAAIPFVIEAVELPWDARASVWEDALERLGAGDAELPDIASFRLAPEQIVVAAASALTQAAGYGRSVAPTDFSAGVRSHNAGRMDGLVRRVTPAASFSDIVVTDGQMRDLLEVLNRVRTRALVRTTWGMGGSHRSRGVTCLFAGPSGTGKTLAAEVLAGELGVDLYAIDLSQVVDKYIGETEKNLDRIFSGGEGVNGLLFFDEADALFGKRSDVRDAHDRHANIEVAYLLQRMEQFDGVAVLATNMQAHLDEAFTRRIDIITHFNKPDEHERRRLWRLHLPDSLPQSDDIDLDFLAKAMDVTGGIIRNITLGAAHAAAAEHREVTMADLVRAAARDHLKRGRLVNVDDFGPYGHLIA